MYIKNNPKKVVKNAKYWYTYNIFKYINFKFKKGGILNGRKWSKKARRSSRRS